MGDWAAEQAERIIPLLLSRMVTKDEALGLITTALQTAVARGKLLASGETGERMVAKFDQTFAGQGDLFSGGKAARDEGIARVSKNNREWIAAALTFISGVSLEWRGQMEDLRPIIEQNVGAPTKANAYGALTRMAIRKKLIRRTGVRVQMKRKDSHARMTDEYRRVPPA